ncbi:hypothetical protein [Chromobacterium sp. IIBBL 290-4]|uniref:hypothetical protein n=1 Tax=Chromobacterium sp. IIBBL 290-4 TaxID=2953890 RepID=UPI0020B7C3C0|nr:hypothetical protein [Chromobacterium sp. IIBBL 290-4]UTH74316.1 hypothetical protein NKT35_22720 [Chromobacterium sp. IIBBL 290-4]
MQNLFVRPRQQQIYQLSIICPSMSLGHARREIRGLIQKNGLRIQQWLEQPQAVATGSSPALSPWLISADFRCSSETCMHLLQGIAVRLGSMPLTRIKLDCLSAFANDHRARAI